VRLNRLLLVLIAIVMIGGMLGCQQGGKFEPYTQDRVKLTDADRDALVAAARGYLTQDGFDPKGLSETLTKKYNKDVFITLFAPRTAFIRAHAQKDTIAASLEAACAELKNDAGFKSRFKDQLGDTRIAVHVIDNVTELNTRRIARLRRIVEPGYHGLIVEHMGKRTFQLGEDVIFNGWGMKGFNDNDRVMGKKLTQLCLDKIRREAKLSKEEFNEAPLSYFSTHAMVEVEPNGKAVETYRAMILPPRKLTRKDALEAAWLAAGHLAMHTDPEGKMGYHYRPIPDKFTNGYNIVRHAGSVWGLFGAYKATGDVTLLEAGRRALDYLGHSIMVPPENKDIAFLDYKGRAYLGTNALAAMSLCEIPQELLTPEWKTKREMFGNGLMAFQVPDGRFYKSWDEVKAGGPVPDPQPRYFPGEAFLAYMKLYEQDQQEKWLKAAKLCADWQIDDYLKNPKQQPDAWVVQALCKLYRYTKDERIPDVVWKMVNWHFRHQWGMPEKTTKLPYEDYFGGADNATPPRSTPTSARNEANVEAWHLAVLLGNKEMADKLSESVQAAIWHNIVDQYRPVNSYWTRRPDRVLGGIRGALIANDIRIDYNQHFLSSAINALELFEQANGDGEFGPLSNGKILDVLKLGIAPDEAAKRLTGAAAAEGQ